MLFRPKLVLNFSQQFPADGFSFFYLSRGFTPGYQYFAPKGAKNILTHAPTWNLKPET